MGEKMSDVEAVAMPEAEARAAVEAEFRKLPTWVKHRLVQLTTLAAAAEAVYSPHPSQSSSDALANLRTHALAVLSVPPGQLLQLIRNEPSKMVEVADPVMHQVLTEAMQVLKLKGNDYTMGKADFERLHNFDTAASFLGLKDTQVLGVYLYKHVASVFAYLGRGKVESEPIRGRIVDCINYLLLLALMVERAEQKAQP